MKKIIAALIMIVLLLTPSFATAKELYKASYEITEGDYYITFEVRQKDVSTDGFYAGRKLGDYLINGYCTYQGRWFDYVKWADDDYVIVEGKQDIVIALDKHSDISFIVEMNGIIPPKKKLKTSMNFSTPVSMVAGGDFIGELPGIAFIDALTGEIVKGDITFLNYDNTRIGQWYLEWVFTPDDPSYETMTGYIPLDVRAPDPETPDKPTIPSLTATQVILDTKTAYDINLNDKIAGSTYLWTSSNPEIVEVNPANGKIRAISEGTAVITCEITLPSGEVIIIQSVVTVGYDENAPMLTETILDLEVGDKFDINIENKIAKSKYRWVSSDRSIVKVNSSNGKVTAIGLGEAYVTCTITTPDNQVIVLRCDISVMEAEEPEPAE